MIEVELVRQSADAVDTYLRLFEQRYGDKPQLSGTSFEVTTFKDLLRTGLSYKRLTELLSQYFAMEGEKDWFVNNAHSLRIFKDNINVVIARNAKAKTYLKPVYVIGMCGPAPVCSNRIEDALPGFTPLLYEDWRAKTPVFSEKEEETVWRQKEEGTLMWYFKNATMVYKSYGVEKKQGKFYLNGSELNDDDISGLIAKRLHYDTTERPKVPEKPVVQSLS